MTGRSRWRGWRSRPYHYRFGVPAALLAGVPFGLLYLTTAWHPYLIWLISLSAATFALFVLDKLLSKMGGQRAPELVLWLFSLAGGFPGQLGGHLIGHKTNVSRHPEFALVLIASLILHGLLAYYFWGGWN